MKSATFPSLRVDPTAASAARDAISRVIKVLEEFPFTCRKAEASNPLMRELIVPFGSAGYVALFEIEDNETVTILAVPTREWQGLQLRATNSEY